MGGFRASTHPTSNQGIILEVSESALPRIENGTVVVGAGVANGIRRLAILIRMDVAGRTSLPDSPPAFIENHDAIFSV